MNARLAETARRLIPGLWAGVLLCIALIATPAPFATLASADAGRVVARIFAQEAPLSLVLAVLVVMLERRVASDRPGAPAMNAGVMLELGALLCTVAGYYGLQPMMAAARQGQGALSFGQLHAISFGLFGAKMLMVGALAVRAVRAAAGTGPRVAGQS